MGRLKIVAMSFDPERLVQARELKGLLKKELAQSVGVTPAAVSAWERGLKKPSQESIFNLSNELEVEPEFFQASKFSVTSASTAPHFRSLRSTPQRIRNQAYQFGILTATVVDTLQGHLILPAPELPQTEYPQTEHEVEVAAQLLREYWNLGKSPISDLLLQAEKKGIIASINENATASVDAYSMWVGAHPYIILNPIKNDHYRQRFDIAHELGHLVMHEGAEPGEKVAEEQAHHFASEFLAPTSELLPELPTAINEEAWKRLLYLKEKWGLSIQALLFRMRKLKTISENSYRGAMATLSRWNWRRAEPGRITDWDRPALLSKSIELLEANGISREQIAKEANLKVSHLEKVVGPAPEQKIEVIL